MIYAGSQTRPTRRKVDEGGDSGDLKACPPTGGVRGYGTIGARGGGVNL